MTDQPPPPAPAPTSDPTGDWSPNAAAAAPPPAETAPPAPPAAGKPPSKVRTYITFGVLAVIVVVLAFFISQNQSADDLAIGQCFDEPNRNTEITTVVKHACTEAHDAEVFHVVEYTGGDAYPISLSIDSFIDETCVPAFEAYVGEPFDTSSTYNLGWFYPSRETWEDKGDRTFTCYVTRIDDAKLTESVKGIAAS